jgi:hypothetical protein
MQARTTPCAFFGMAWFPQLTGQDELLQRLARGEAQDAGTVVGAPAPSFGPGRG